MSDSLGAATTAETAESERKRPFHSLVVGIHTIYLRTQLS